jgi:hypothetical protein
MDEAYMAEMRGAVSQMFTMFTVIVLLQVAQIAAKAYLVVLQRRVLVNQGLVVQKSEDTLDDAAKLLDFTKEYSKSAHLHHKDAAQVLEKVKEKTGTVEGLGHDSSEEVLRAVEQVPEKTADRVLQKIHEGDSGTSGSIIK